MRCPKCGSEIPEGYLYCEKCGEEIQIVPDYDPLLDIKFGDAAEAEDAQEKEKTQNASAIISTDTFEEQLDENAQKRRRIKLYVARAVLILLSIGVIVLIYLTHRDVKRSDSLEYQLEQAEKARNFGEYSKALEYYKRALDLGGDDLEILREMSEVYYLNNEQAWYEVTLRRIIDHPGASKEVLRDCKRKLITILVKKGDFDSISKMILESDDQELRSENQKYLSPTPAFSLEEGVYEDIQSLQITVDPGYNGEIYYTLDGSTPGDNANLYQLPIILEQGKVTIRACFINEYGVKSEIITATYMIGTQ